jgi:hypothetical protein
MKWLPSKGDVLSFKVLWWMRICFWPSSPFSV